ncbi:MAG: hypothetical protein NTW19_07040 [Planctomycetota bacterium]|nr:hypothetical protein [Planctomycetota bacterium]
MSHATKHRSDHETDGAAAALAGVTASIGAAVQSAREDLGDVAGKVGEVATQAAARVRETVDDGLARTTAAKKSLEQTIAARPLTSIAVAAGVGLVVGLIWRRR